MAETGLRTQEECVTWFLIVKEIVPASVDCCDLQIS